MTTEQIITKVTGGMQSGPYFEYLVSLGHENAERWYKTHLDALEYLRALTKKELVEKLYTYDAKHARQLMAYKKEDLVTLVWRRKMNAARNEWMAKNA